MWLDATHKKVREGGRVVSLATLVAVGVSPDGWRQWGGEALDMLQP